MSPPIKLKYQNDNGTRLSAFRSDTTHWMIHRPKKSPCPKNPMPTHIISVVVTSRRSRPSRSSFFSVFVTQYSRLHPPDCKQIVNSPEQPIPHTVLRNSVSSRVVAHRDFRH